MANDGFGHPLRTGPGPQGAQLNRPRRQNAFDMMEQQLRQWGLGTLIPDLRKFIQQGYTNTNTLTLKLSQTDAFKQRFAGNELRLKNGLSELSPAEYLATERSYRQVLQSYGLPKGFYDQHTDFVKMIGGDVSPAELDKRAQIAANQFVNAPEQMKQMWVQYGFGTNKGDIIAGILDPTRATQVIQNRAQQVAIGAAALEQGLDVGKNRAQQLQQRGVTEDQAQQGYSEIAQWLPNEQQIAGRFGESLSQRDEENAVLLGDAEAQRKRQRLQGEETALFKATPGMDQGALGISQSY